MSEEENSLTEISKNPKTQNVDFYFFTIYTLIKGIETERYNDAKLFCFHNIYWVFRK